MSDTTLLPESASTLESKPQKRIVVGAEAVLALFGYPFERGPSSNDFRFRLHTTSEASWRSQLLVHESERLVRLCVFLSDNLYPKSREWWVRELVARIDDKIGVLGAFGIDWDVGAVTYRATADLRYEQPLLQVLTDLLNGVAFPLAVWEHAYRHVLNASVLPADALTASLIEVRSHEGAHVTKAVRRVLLRVVPGKELETALVKPSHPKMV